jgi:AGZA family xanthine/uracil permease-like MFS transporter
MRRFFHFEELGTNYRRESVAGVTTFLTMACIIPVLGLLAIRWRGCW